MVFGGASHDSVAAELVVRPATGLSEELVVWSSQDLVEMLLQGLVGRFELIGTDSAEMAVAAR